MTAPLVSDGDLVELIDLVYQAGSDPGFWPSFVERVQRLVPFSAFTAILAVDGTNLIQVAATAGHDPASVERYYAHYHKLNCYEALLRAVPVGRVITGSELAPRDWLKRQVFYNEWLVPAGNFTRGCTLTMAKDHGRLMRIFFDLPEEYVEYEPASARLLGRLGPHILRAFQLNETLRGSVATAQTLSSLLALIDAAAFVVRPSGHVAELNRLADAMIAKGQFLKLSFDRKLAFAAPNTQTEYEAALRNATDATRAAPMPFVADSRDGPEVVNVLPLQNAGNTSPVEAGSAALVTIRSLRPRTTTAPGQLKALFGLSDREAQVATLLSTGVAIEHIAETLGVTRVTVRNQVAAVMAKTGVHRQAELAALIANLKPAVSVREDR